MLIIYPHIVNTKLTLYKNTLSRVYPRRKRQFNPFGVFLYSITMKVFSLLKNIEEFIKHVLENFKGLKTTESVL